MRSIAPFDREASLNVSGSDWVDYNLLFQSNRGQHRPPLPLFVFFFCFFFFLCFVLLFFFLVCPFAQLMNKEGLHSSPSESNPPFPSPEVFSLFLSRSHFSTALWLFLFTTTSSPVLPRPTVLEMCLKAAPQIPFPRPEYNRSHYSHRAN